MRALCDDERIDAMTCAARCRDTHRMPRRHAARPSSSLASRPDRHADDAMRQLCARISRRRSRRTIASLPRTQRRYEGEPACSPESRMRQGFAACIADRLRARCTSCATREAVSPKRIAALADTIGASPTTSASAGGGSPRHIDARLAFRHRIARRRASCASVDRVMRRRNALPIASTKSTPIDVPSTSHRCPIDGRPPPSTAVDLHRSHSDRCRTTADTIAWAHRRSAPPRSPLADARQRSRTHAPTACGHAQISLPPARALLLTSAVGPAAPAADGRPFISEEETMHRRTTCKRA